MKHLIAILLLLLLPVALACFLVGLIVGLPYNFFRRGNEVADEAIYRFVKKAKSYAKTKDELRRKV